MELNSDLTPFEAGVQDKAISAAGGRKITKEKEMKKKSEKAPNNRAKKTQLKKTPRKKVLNNVITGAGALHCAEDMAVDANEPIYCLCNQVSYGKMVGCDNPDCPIDWFHFQCVKLTTNPKGKWFCPKCKTNKKSK